MLKSPPFNRKIIVGAAVTISLVLAGFTGCKSEEEPIALTDISAIDISTVPRISLQELKSKLDSGGDLVIVDARSTEEYEYSHITGSISIPLLETGERYSEIKGYKEVITYCT